MTEKSIQEEIAEAMPPIPEDRRDNDKEIHMAPEEQRELTDNINAMVEMLRDKGYSAPDLNVVFNGFAHRLNARQYDPHEYDRIALTIELRDTIQTWNDEQDHEVPELEIARALEDLSKVYRDTARKELYKRQGRKEAQDDE